MNKIFKFVVVSGCALLVNSFAFAEGNVINPPSTKSTVAGTVIDNYSGESLAGVAVSIEGTDTKVYTDLDGNFTISDIKPGKYNLILSMISYKNSLVENIELLANENEKLEIKLDNK